MSPEASKAPPPTISAALWRELESSRQLGLIGPSPLDEHVRHAIGYLGAAGVVPGAVADLGSGGGLPALVLAERWPAQGMARFQAVAPILFDRSWGVRVAAFNRR